MTFEGYVDIFTFKNQSKVKLSVFLFFILALSPLQEVDVFQKHGNHAAVTHITIPPSMFNMLSKFKVNTNDPETESLLLMIKSLQTFRVMTTKDATIAKDMAQWLATEIEQTDLTSLFNVKKDGVRVKFGAVFSPQQDKVKRLVMWVEGLDGFVAKNPEINLNSPADLDYILLEIKGDLALDQISALTSIVNIPGGEYLDILDR